VYFRLFLGQSEKQFCSVELKDFIKVILRFSQESIHKKLLTGILMCRKTITHSLGVKLIIKKFSQNDGTQVFCWLQIYFQKD
jgi:hypothetical protein